MINKQDVAGFYMLNCKNPKEQVQKYIEENDISIPNRAIVLWLDRVDTLMTDIRVVWMKEDIPVNLMDLPFGCPNMSYNDYVNDKTIHPIEQTEPPAPPASQPHH